MDAPLVTIIIPTLNSAKTLQAALDSVLRQEFGELEVLVIDSVSKDDTLAILERNAQADQRLRYISEPDKGIYDAMNKGIRHAKGAWIYFLGSDDRLADAKVLGSIAVALRNSRYDLIYGNISVAGRPGSFYGEVDFGRLLEMNISHQAIFYHKDIFNRIGDYNIRYRAYADWEFNIRCFRDPAIRIAYCPLVIAVYGVGGISSVHDAVFLREVLYPANLKMLEMKGSGYLRSIRRYDRWWRLIRNGKIRTFQELRELAGTETIPLCILKMAGWQQKIPYKILLAGVLSKFFMLISYLDNRLAGSI